MLLINPRRLLRSRNTSCRTPFSTTAARASCMLALMRISVLMGCRSKQFRGFEQRQSHYSGVAAAQIGYENGGAALYGVGACLVARFPGFPVRAGLGGIYAPESDLAAAHPDVALCGDAQCDSGEDFVAAAG